MSPRELPRREFLGTTLAAGFCSMLPGSQGASVLAADEIPTPELSGPARAETKPLDDLLLKFVSDKKIPGASLAITRGSQLVYARGCGWSDVAAREAVQPTSLFRIASISKPITAVAILQFAAAGRLKLSDKILDLLEIIPLLEPGQEVDPRWRDITIQHCLQHTGGWDRDKSFDPMFRSVKIAEATGTPAPADPAAIIRYMAGQPLDFTPGERYAYSNFGYCLLGRVLEKLTGETYEAPVRRQVLLPVGACTAQLGHTLADQRVQGEVKYYDDTTDTGPSVFAANLGQQVPWPYGGWNLEAMDAHGGWIASAVDLVRFASDFSKPECSRLLPADWVGAMYGQRPAGLAGHTPEGKPKETFYGLGWMIRPVKSETVVNAWHTGSLDGTSTILVRRWDGFCWAALFNSRNNKQGGRLSTEFDPLIHQAVDAITSWPTEEPAV